MSWSRFHSGPGAGRPCVNQDCPVPKSANLRSGAKIDPRVETPPLRTLMRGLQCDPGWGSSSAGEPSVEPSKNRRDSAVPSSKVGRGPASFLVPPDLLSLWKTTYPAVDVEQQIGEAFTVELANPSKRKRNIARYLTNWLGREQDKVPLRSNGDRPTETKGWAGPTAEETRRRIAAMQGEP